MAKIEPSVTKWPSNAYGNETALYGRELICLVAPVWGP